MKFSAVSLTLFLLRSSDALQSHYGFGAPRYPPHLHHEPPPRRRQAHAQQDFVRPFFSPSTAVAPQRQQQQQQPYVPPFVRRRSSIATQSVQEPQAAPQQQQPPLHRQPQEQPYVHIHNMSPPLYGPPFQARSTATTTTTAPPPHVPPHSHSTPHTTTAPPPPYNTDHGAHASTHPPHSPPLEEEEEPTTDSTAAGPPLHEDDDDNWYAVLGVDTTADEKTIKRAYRRLAKLYHPDTADVNEKERMTTLFQEINEAYDTLKDKTKKRDYDLELRNRRQTTTTVETPSWGTKKKKENKTKAPFRPGQKYETTAVLDFRTAIFGGTCTVIVEKKKTECTACGGVGYGLGTCHVCHGAGETMHEKQTALGTFSAPGTCETCDGTGVVDQKCPVCGGAGVCVSNSQAATEQLVVQIPSGVWSEPVLRIPGQGHAGRGGAPAGDLWLHLQVREHSIFRPSHSSLFEKEMGDKDPEECVNCPTVDGYVTCIMRQRTAAELEEEAEEERQRYLDRFVFRR